MRLSNLHAIEPTRSRRQRRVDGVKRLKFDFHTGTLDLAVTLEKHGLWSAWELHRHFNLGKICKRPPPKKGGEPPLLPPEKGKNDGPVDTLNVKPPPLPKKPRKKALKGEDLIDQAQEIDFAAMVAASGPGVPSCGGAVTPSTRIVSRRGCRGWFLFGFRGRSDRFQ